MRRLRNRNKLNQQLFDEYYIMLSTSRSTQQLYENKRILEKFHAMIGEFPPTPELAIQFLSQYKDRKATTRSRILFTLKGFFKYSGLPAINLKIKEPKRLPQYVYKEDIDKILEAKNSQKISKLPYNQP